MLTPIEAPLPCFAIDHDAHDKRCIECPHNADCRELTGYRLNRVTLDAAQFSLVPETLEYRKAAWEVDEQSIEATYCETYRQVFGCDPSHQVGKFKARVLELAKEASCSVHMFMLTVMFAHEKASAEEFTAGILADGRALHRVKTYAQACRSTFAAFDTHTLAAITGSDLELFDLKRRMLVSEMKAGEWIVRFKLFHAGQPYLALFNELEAELDPNWLAIETHYAEIMAAFSRRQDAPGHEETRHLALQTFARLKKHKHQAISNFRAREAIMPQAIRNVLSQLYYAAQDFEIENLPVTDPLRLWNRLGLAVQHMECLKFVQQGEGIYAR